MSSPPTAITTDTHDHEQEQDTCPLYARQTLSQYYRIKEWNQRDSF